MKDATPTQTALRQYLESTLWRANRLIPVCTPHPEDVAWIAVTMHHQGGPEALLTPGAIAQAAVCT